MPVQKPKWIGDQMPTLFGSGERVESGMRRIARQSAELIGEPPESRITSAFVNGAQALYNIAQIPSRILAKVAEDFGKREHGLSDRAISWITARASEMVDVEAMVPRSPEEALLMTPVAFGGVYTKRTLATMKALGEEAMAPPAKGMVRLFRGEPYGSYEMPSFISRDPRLASPPIPALEQVKGQWFTRSASYAKRYPFETNFAGEKMAENTRLMYVDVPKKEALAYKVSQINANPEHEFYAAAKHSLDEKNEFILPKKWANKGMMSGPPPGEVMRSLVRGDLEAGVAFGKVAGGRSRFLTQRLEQVADEHPETVAGGIDDILSAIKAHDPESPLLQPGIDLRDKFLSRVAEGKTAVGLGRKYGAFLKASRKLYPSIIPNNLLVSKSGVIKALLQEEGPEAFTNIRAANRGENPLEGRIRKQFIRTFPNASEERIKAHIKDEIARLESPQGRLSGVRFRLDTDPRVAAIREERDYVGPMAFGPTEWVNTRGSVNLPNTPESAWEYALRGSRGMEHREGLPPVRRTPVGTVVEETYAVRAPGAGPRVRQTSGSMQEQINRQIENVNFGISSVIHDLDDPELSLSSADRESLERRLRELYVIETRIRQSGWRHSGD